MMDIETFVLLEDKDKEFRDLLFVIKKEASNIKVT